MDEQFIFVYGTLRKEFNHPIHTCISGSIDYMDKAYFRGILYEVGKFPGAVAVSDTERRITGELYRIKKPTKLFAVLDIYEGYHSGFPTKSLFIRVKKKVKLITGKSIQAWIYLYNRPVKKLKEIESGDYVAYCGKQNS